MRSLWHDTANLPRFPTLEGDVKTDVLIIGGGICGILTGYFLGDRGIDCIIVEKDTICGKTTGNTTAKITYQHGLIYDKLLKNCGITAAKLYLQANKAAFEKYAELSEKIDCDYEICDNYVYSEDRQKLDRELRALEIIGFPCEFANALPIPLWTAGAVRFRDQAQFHPLKFLSALSEKLNILEHTHVCEMVENTAITDHGKIAADRVVIATHFPFINKHGSYFLKLYQHRSYVIALENAPEIHGMYVDEKDEGLSFRQSGDLLLIGGGSHRTGKSGGTWNELRTFASKYFPDATEKYYWSTQDCMSLDSMPYIGRYSKRTRDLYVATGFNKWGMTGAMLAAIILADILTGNENEFASLFSPQRSIMKPQLFENMLESMKNLLTFSGRRCPHLGCALKWNSAEHSWDCPCHGSRFNERGKLLDNPANGDLY